MIGDDDATAAVAAAAAAVDGAFQRGCSDGPLQLLQPQLPSTKMW